MRIVNCDEILNWKRTKYRWFETFTSRTDYYYYQYQNWEWYSNNETIQLKVWTIIATTPKKIRLKNCIKCNTNTTFRNNRKQTFAITLIRRWNGFGFFFLLYGYWVWGNSQLNKKKLLQFMRLFFSFPFSYCLNGLNVISNKNMNTFNRLECFFFQLCESVVAGSWCTTFHKSSAGHLSHSSHLRNVCISTLYIRFM